MRKANKARKSSNKKADPIINAAIRIRSENGMTISAHKQVLDKQGCVMFAKLGKALGSSFLGQLNNQTNRGVTTFLFLASYEAPKMPYGYYQCELARVHEKLSAEQQLLVPAYLQQSIPKIETWFEIKSIERLSREAANRIYVLSSGREISSAVGGTASLFKVGIKGDSELDKDANIPPRFMNSSGSSSELEEDYDSEDRDFVEDWYDSLDISADDSSIY